MAASRTKDGIEVIHRITTEHGPSIEVTTDGCGLVSLRVSEPYLLLTEAEAEVLIVFFQRASADA